ncbi:hypothetical protein FUAX_40120 (plasmid) [Fulvitalea axinellae]|uniref:ParB/Sulfiredoxin domain-containing protein n=1 Tax=Fulvitalea axinellae TaxID=1182444 RepID=A0AAU9DGB1_9BACT|nr:hypothetical protein FUAX_40120 [Fulvitalea axinellae]
MAKKKIAPLTVGSARKPMVTQKLTEQALAEQEKIKQSIRVHEELRTYIPPLAEPELRKLEENILKDGIVKEPLMLWKKDDKTYYIVDGHNRYSIIQRHAGKNLNYKVIVRNDLADMADVKREMLNIQFGRRNLSKNQISYLRGLRYLDEKQEHGGKKTKPQNGVSVGNTAQRLAEEFHVGKNTIERDGHFASGVRKLPADEARVLLSGESDLLKRDIEFLGKNDVNVSSWLETVRKERSKEEEPVVQVTPPKEAKPKSSTTKKDRFTTWLGGYSKEIDIVIKKGTAEEKRSKAEEIETRIGELKELLQKLSE